MNVLVVGIGLQGRAVVHDLDRSGKVDRIFAADLDPAAVERALAPLGCTRASAMRLDVANHDALGRAVSESGAGLVVCMVPPTFQKAMARAAIEGGAHFVSSSYTGEVASLEPIARDRGLVLLTEMGLDPGIDLVMARAAVDSLDEVQGLHMYGGGFPEPEAADPPLRYRITWTFEGVLRAYRRPARVRREGQDVGIEADHIFDEDNVFSMRVPDVGMLEAYPNGDALHYAPVFGLGPAARDLGRFTLRWPGHCALWRSLVAMGLLDEDPIDLGGADVAPRTFLARLLEPRLRYRDDQRDLAVLRVEAWGLKEGRPRTVTLDFIDQRDLKTGLFAMNRTVGYSAAIGAQLVLSGGIGEPGLRSPARDVPPEPFFEELRSRGMRLRRREEDGLPGRMP